MIAWSVVQKAVQRVDQKVRWWVDLMAHLWDGQKGETLVAEMVAPMVHLTDFQKAHQRVVRMVHYLVDLKAHHSVAWMVHLKVEPMAHQWAVLTVHQLVAQLVQSWVSRLEKMKGLQKDL